MFALLEEARQETTYARNLGNLTIAAFFKGEKRKERRELLDKLRDAIQYGYQKEDELWDHLLRGDNASVLTPFHWEIEFPEVFDGEPWVRCGRGKPAILGRETDRHCTGEPIPDWLTTLHRDCSRNADIVAHFFRRAFFLIRRGGNLGLVATNTVAQGDTRAGGLR